ncbi:hypothetical protein FB382_001604 [Nocardioides ginsengisegetis]|uniref:DUF2157 domain-containing protein n=1 Tax=Nocardioides ginsengisegetis TaxID=661491 RepID=A0A7W3IZ79_9ACTN|nr:DUF2157 domain-containing protein [Nocardioides ginsengisegetis]MBA8803313.1 hypothetical protein [Nocardioides ginsengisegetis]
MSRALVPDPLLQAWVAEGIITADQADSIRARQGVDSRAVGTASPGPALEALGYLGGVIVAIAALLLASRFWGDLTPGTRLALVGVAAAVLLLGGSVVPNGDVGSRLRSVLWLAATVAFAGSLSILGSDLLDLAGDHVGVLTTSGATVLAAVLWVAHRAAVQQLVLMVGAMATAGVTIADLFSGPARPGLGVWAVAAAWAALAQRGLIGRRRLSLGVAAVGLIVGSMLTMSTDAGIVLALATVGAVLLAAVLIRDLVLLAIGAVGTLRILPRAIDAWFPDTAAVPVALLAVGIVLVAVTLWAARRGRSPSGRGGR